MNEQIGQLAEQAGLLGPSSRVGNSHEAAEKFAELIIVKCANIIWHEADMKDSAEINEGGYKILEYFGIDWTTK